MTKSKNTTARFAEFGRAQADEVRQLQGDVGALRAELIELARTAGDDLRAADRETRHDVYRQVGEIARQRRAGRVRRPHSMTAQRVALGIHTGFPLRLMILEKWFVTRPNTRHPRELRGSRSVHRGASPGFPR